MSRGPRRRVGDGDERGDERQEDLMTLMHLLDHHLLPIPTTVEFAVEIGDEISVSLGKLFDPVV